jgi:hypothetical protein
MQLLGLGNSASRFYLSGSITLPSTLRIRGSMFVILRPSYLLSRLDCVTEWSPADLGGIRGGFFGEGLTSADIGPLTGTRIEFCTLLHQCNLSTELMQNVYAGRPLPLGLLETVLGTTRASAISRIPPIQSFSYEVVLENQRPADLNTEVETLFVPYPYSMPRDVRRILRTCADVRRFNPSNGLDEIRQTT